MNKKHLIAALAIPGIALAALTATSPDAEARRAPEAIVCQGGKLVLSDNYRTGVCVYPKGKSTPSASKLSRAWGMSVTTTKLTCAKGSFIAPDRMPGGAWGYCEKGKPTAEVKRWGK